MMKLFLFMFLLLVSLLALACTPDLGIAPQAPVDQAPTPEVPAENASPEEAPAEAALQSCVLSADCRGGLQCVNGVCGTVSRLYDTNCAGQKCNFKDVSITTSDGESYTLARGQGSYTYAGAIEWKVMSGPSYCPGSDVVVPVQILKKNTGVVIGEEIVTLAKGQTSKVVTHPTIPRVQFTVKVNDYAESCS